MTTELSVSAGDGLPGTAPPPDGRPLLTVLTYDEAARAVDALAEARFPVRYVSIVGHGVRTVENLAGRWGPARAVASTTFAGGIVGLLFGLLFDWWGAVDTEVGWGWIAFYGLVYGALAGLIVSLLFARVGQRDFSSVRSIDAASYDVTLIGSERAEAMRILHGAGIV